MVGGFYTPVRILVCTLLANLFWLCLMSELNHAARIVTESWGVSLLITLGSTKPLRIRHLSSLRGHSRVALTVAVADSAALLLVSLEHSSAWLPEAGGGWRHCHVEGGDDDSRAASSID